VEVESTIRPAKGRIAGFEGREGHRTPFAPARRISSLPKTHRREEGPDENVPIKAHTVVSKNSIQARVVSSVNACVRFSAAARS
jgi:hypothetical protein